MQGERASCEQQSSTASNLSTSCQTCLIHLPLVHWPASCASTAVRGHALCSCVKVSALGKIQCCRCSCHFCQLDATLLCQTALLLLLSIVLLLHLLSNAAHTLLLLLNLALCLLELGFKRLWSVQPHLWHLQTKALSASHYTTCSMHCGWKLV